MNNKNKELVNELNNMNEKEILYLYEVAWCALPSEKGHSNNSCGINLNARNWSLTQ